jgi:hypothetical protein
MKANKFFQYYPAILLLLIGVVYLLLKIASAISNPASFFVFSDENRRISSAELISEARTYIFIVLGIAGGILLLRLRPAGWLIAVPYFIVYSIIATWWSILAFQLQMLPELLHAVLLFSSLALALYALNRREAYARYQVSRRILGIATVLLIVLGYVIFFAGS